MITDLLGEYWCESAGLMLKTIAHTIADQDESGVRVQEELIVDDDPPTYEPPPDYQEVASSLISKEVPKRLKLVKK